ncbi:hypothetical protein FXO37_01609 [Capsicum annuum]|nr:hypothetical protein FXO37_01609 [Capsicum annuum]
MLDSMKYQVYKRKSMYRYGGFPLAFQCWFYECCPYANDKLVVRVGDSVPRVLYWSVTIRPNYRKVKFTFSDRNCEQVVLTNIEPTCIEKNIFQLPVFKPVPQKEHVAFKKYDGDHIDVVARDHLSDNVVDEIGKETVGVGDRIDTNAGDRPTTVVPDSEISKYTQPDKIGEHSVIEKAVGKIDTDFGSTSVVLVATEVLVGVGSNKKPTAIYESPYVSKFNSGCSNVQGQPTTCIDKVYSRKHIFSMKHPFTISITEPFLDMKLLSSFNSLVYSKSVNNLANAFDFGVVMIKTKEWFYTLGYAGVLLTDTDKRIDGIATADSFDIRMVDGLPTQKNTDCGIFVTVFAEYMIEGIQIPASVDDIDSIRSRYGVLLWQYGKIKQKQRAISDDLLEDRKKN